MNEDIRPDPDQLLSAISRREESSKSGKLSIFFGMSAGVGKTYTMLEAARARKAEGVDVVIGVVETHGRAETAALLESLEIIPRKKIVYRDTKLEDMDLDAVLARRPQLALVDELAHTNVPGSRHPKRWQDVVELLDAGIDVYSTLNVQHVESRKEIVESIAGLTIRETVPDALLERAANIELVDITPTDLLQRLSEGKVYLGERAETAAANFFKEDKLTALRELALRMTAEKVDSELHQLIATGGGEYWKPSERLMVAVSHSPFSENLIRATRRIAYNLNAPWIAVHVETAAPLSEEDRATLTKNLRLVSELGGELVSTSDTDIAIALERIAHQRRVTQLVVGKPTSRWKDLFVGTILDRLARSSNTYDILVLRPDKSIIPPKSRNGKRIGSRSLLKDYGLVLAIVFVITLFNYLITPFIGYKAVGYIFLFMVLLLSFWFSLGAVLTAALLGGLTWNFFFIPPVGTFIISDTEDVLMVLSYLAVALVAGTLAHRIRTRQDLIRRREERTEFLYDLAKTLAVHTNISSIISTLSEKIEPLLQGEVDLVLPTKSGTLENNSVLAKEWLKLEKEKAVAHWAFEHEKTSGWSTDTLPLSAALYIPMKGASGKPVGILAFRPNARGGLTQDESNLLAAITHQLALSLDRELLRNEAQQTERLQESERLMQTVIDSVSHELRTPLTALAGTSSALASVDIISDTKRRNELVNELQKMTSRLNRIVGNLLDMSRLSSGGMKLQRDWHEITDVVSSALNSSKGELHGRKIEVKIDDNLPLVRIDFRLFTQVLENILSNAAMYTPPDAIVEIECRSRGSNLEFIVLDNGPGIPEDSLPHIFTKFYRVPGTRPGGVGLGLSIAKAIVEAHGGSITARNRPTGGACLEISLPIENQPSLPPEEN